MTRDFNVDRPLLDRPTFSVNYWPNRSKQTIFFIFGVWIVFAILNPTHLDICLLHLMQILHVKYNKIIMS